MKATIVDLRYHMKDVLRAIDRGEIVTVLYRGKEKAKLVSVPRSSETSSSSSSKTKDQPFFGIWRDRKDLPNPAAYVRSLRQPRPALHLPSVKKRSSSKSLK